MFPFQSSQGYDTDQPACTRRFHPFCRSLHRFVPAGSESCLGICRGVESVGSDDDRSHLGKWIRGASFELGFQFLLEQVFCVSVRLRDWSLGVEVFASVCDCHSAQQCRGDRSFMRWGSARLGQVRVRCAALFRRIPHTVQIYIQVIGGSRTFARRLLLRTLHPRCAFSTPRLHVSYRRPCLAANCRSVIRHKI